MELLPLTGAQKTKLRGLGQHLEPSLKIGKGGLTPESVRELERLLEAHELVKVRFVGIERDERATLSDQLAAKARCHHAGSVGHIALFYREHADPAKRSVQLVEED